MSIPTNRPLAVPKPRLPPKPASGKSKAAHRDSTSDPVEEKEVPYEERQLRNQAAQMLANEEMLLLLSRQRNESVLQTRIYCEARAAGLKDEMLRFDYTLDLSDERDGKAVNSKGQPATAKGTARVVSGSSKNAAPSKRDKDRDQGRRSTRSAR